MCNFALRNFGNQRALLLLRLSKYRILYRRSILRLFKCYKELETTQCREEMLEHITPSLSVVQPNEHTLTRVVRRVLLAGRVVVHNIQHLLTIWHIGLLDHTGKTIIVLIKEYNLYIFVVEIQILVKVCSDSVCTLLCQILITTAITLWRCTCNAEIRQL